MEFSIASGSVSAAGRSAKICIVEDDALLREELSNLLQNNGYETAAPTDFPNAVRDILAAAPDLVLLDIGLPQTDGEHILRGLRAQTQTPVLMLTSRESELDELLSISLGADDYVTKPFRSQILLARIGAILKRTLRGAAGADVVLRAGDLSLDLAGSRLSCAGRTAELSGNERKILQCLMEQRGRVVPREALIRYLWDSESYVDDNTLTVNITRVRGKLEALGCRSQIATRRGQGYEFMP